MGLFLKGNTLALRPTRDSVSLAHWKATLLLAAHSCFATKYYDESSCFAKATLLLCEHSWFVMIFSGWLIIFSGCGWLILIIFSGCGWLIIFSGNTLARASAGSAHLRCYSRKPRGFTTRASHINIFGVATIGRLLKIVGLFCRIQSLL